MKYDSCYAAKDFLREVREASLVLISSLSDSTLPANILTYYCQKILPIMKACRDISASAVRYSVYEPVLLIAKESESACLINMTELTSSIKYCSNKLDDRSAFQLYQSSAENICQRLCDDLEQCEISERLGCDYLRRMILLSEAIIRLSELVCCYDICRSAYPIIKFFAQSSRRELIKMRRLLSLIDEH